jgi:hypothetical protein
MIFLIALVIPDCRASGKSGIHSHDPGRTSDGVGVDCGLLAELVIGPATSGRARWLGNRNDG